MPAPPDVSIVQPYVPTYRVPFFDALDRRLSDVGLRMQVIAPAPSGAQAARRDASSAHPWLVATRTDRSVSVGPATLTYLGSDPLSRDSPVVVLPLWGTLLDAHLALWRPRSRQRVALWGHVHAYVKPANRLDLMVERMMMRRSDHVFAYTSRGGHVAAESGIARERITVLNNTVNVSRLRDEMSKVSEEDIAAFRLEHDLGGSRTYCFIGGLDAEKRIDVLAETLDLLADGPVPVKLLVAGHGTHSTLLQRAANRGQVVMLGYADTRMKALLAHTCEAVVSPGRIGLVAVDALTMGLPVVTTDFQFHAPEVDYLTEGRSLFRVDGGPAVLAECLSHHLWPTVAEPAPELDDMVARFAAGAMQLFEQSPQQKV